MSSKLTALTTNPSPLSTDLLYTVPAAGGAQYKAPVSAYTGTLVVGPAAATDNAVAVFDLTTGKLIKNSTLIYAPAGGTSGALQVPASSTSVAGSVIAVISQTNTATSAGTNIGIALRPTYNQASGTAANTDLLINRTETAVGSGAQYLIQAQQGSSDRFTVTNSGRLSATMEITAGGAATGIGRIVAQGSGSQSAWGLNGVMFRAAATTFTDSSTAGSGTATNAAFSSFAIPTIAATNTLVTTTNAATVYIAGAPTAGTNQTITNPYALWIGGGGIRWDTTANAGVAIASTHTVNVNIGGTVYKILLSNV